MIPVKIKALNQDSSDESNEEEDENPIITKEALEQKLQLGYREALILQKQNKLEDAGNILLQLIESEVLQEADGKVKYVNGRLQPSIFHLKYCCYLNLGNISLKQERYSLALKYYSVATELDDTDLNLWFKIGKVALKIPNLMSAVSAFMETLYRNPKHWPSINSIITATYALGDMAACLLYIHQGLSLDSKYMKGLIFKKRIFSLHPHLKEDFYSLFPNFKNQSTNVEWDEITEQKFFQEIEDLKSRDPIFKKKLCTVKDSEKHSNSLLKPLKTYSWLCLGKSLLKLYDHLYNNSDEMAFFSEITLKTTNNNKELKRDSLVPIPEEPEGTLPDKDKINQVDGKEKSSTENSDAENKPEEIVSKTTSEDSDRDQPNVENGSGNDADDENKDDQDDDDVIKEVVVASAKMGESDNDVSETTLRPKRRKCSPTLADQLKYCDKRRSTRNKTVLKSNEQSLSKILKNLIPANLLLLFEHQDQNNLPSCPTNQVSEQVRYRILQEEKYFGSDKEKSDIEWYIDIYDEQPILELMEAYLRELARKWPLMWPAKLTDMFLEMCRVLKQHGKDIKIFQQVHTTDFNEDSLKQLKDNLQVTILFGELLFDQCFGDANKAPPLDGSIFGGNFSSLLIGEMRDACSMLNATETDIKLWMRALWLEAVLFLQKKNSYGSCSALSMLVDEIPDTSIEVRLPNIKQFYVISQSTAKRLLNTMARNENLNQVQWLFSNKDYEGVVEILENTLKPDSQQLIQIPNETTLSRYQQYTILLAALSELKRYEELFKWCEICCYESFAIHRKSFFDEIDSDMKGKWASLVMNTLNGMMCCLKNVGPSIFKVLSTELLTRLVQTLSSLVCHQIEATDPISEIIASVVDPWILLCNIVHFNEKEQGLVPEDDLNAEVVILPSVSLLFIAHEYLGKRSWCCFDDGALLFYTLDVVEDMFKRSIPFTGTWQTLGQQIDQIFYCLYSHPLKRNKHRYVQDHNSHDLALTWNRAVQAYSFYRPAELPMFDANSKQCTISADTETLLQRMVPLIPKEQNPNQFLELVNQFTNGQINEIPTNENPLQPEVVDMFYLLGDYYFKNKIMGKAIKFYSLDICFNRHRFDSWAAMALARGSQLETKLNSCETIKNESEILKKAELTDKCFKTALELDPSQAPLWIEYGVFCYSIHAFCSRLLKQETTNLSLQMFDTVEKSKNGFLKTSSECFNSATEAWLELVKKEECQDERWLHHYMLGKIAEKNEEKPSVYLDHYLKAMKFLEQNGAEYPSRILYSSPQYYSVEVLEIYYRTHTTILKLLESHEDKPLDDSITQTLISVTNQLAESAFAKSGSNNTPENRETAAAENSSAPKPAENGGKIDSPENVESTVRKVLEEVVDRIVRETDSGSSKRKCSDDVSSLEDGSSPKKPKIEETNSSEEAKKSDSSEPMDTNETTKPPAEPSTVTVNISSDDESSSSSSSDESSSDSDEEMALIKNSKSPEKNRSEKSTNWKQVQKTLTSKCLAALNECICRFPEHYKSYYRLANHYFRSKHDKDIEKARKYLLIDGGLFADRKTSNFFSGIWRIPTAEIDRPGSFAFHMSRSVHLLVDVLRDTQDYKLLLSLSTQLKDTPELDKKYIRDNEREQICKEALSLSAQTLRKHIDNLSSSDSEENRRKLLLEVHKCYQRFPKKDAPFGKLLLSAFYKYTNRKDKVSIEQMLTFCKNLNAMPKDGTAPVAPPFPVPAHTKDSSGTAVVTPKPNDNQSKLQALNFALNAEAKLFSNIPSARKPPSEPKPSPSSNSSNAIPNNLKNLPPAITVTTVPKSKPPTPSWEDSFSILQKMTNNKFAAFMARAKASPSSSSSKEKKFKHDIKHKLNPSKSVLDEKTCRAYVKSIASGLTKEKTKPKPSIVQDKPKLVELPQVSSDKGLTITPVIPKDAKNLSSTSQLNPIIGHHDLPAFKKSSGTSKSDIINVTADRPSLIITPVDSTKSQPTLQQKLAAKKMSHVSTPKSSNASVSKHPSSNSSKSKSAFDITKNLGASGVSIFPLPKPSAITNTTNSSSSSSSSLNHSSSSGFQKAHNLLISKVSGHSIKKSSSPTPSTSFRGSPKVFEGAELIVRKSKLYAMDSQPSTAKSSDEIFKNALRALEESSNIIVTPKVAKKNELEVITIE
ncbi:calcineurin-binding protein cabin-1-like isoform X2 [Planococcus citri]|uniref:calcineurin-binding protein cabin-1-like isoform X2 n=1 Tax=Planococcus citri TaxID=170843 RepID=UPI0031F94000